jgi:outer membrane receptor protein involved in Fe transport
MDISASLADEDDDWQAETGNMENITVTATRTEASVKDVSVAVSAVDEEQIRVENPDVISEMFRGLPGTYFQQTTPGQGVPIIRGLKGSQILHLVDGMRVNNAFFRDAPNQYIGLIDAFAISRIEVVRGAAGSLYGADAMGGVVQFLSPEHDFDTSDWQQTSRLYGSWDSMDDGLTLNARTRGGKSGYGFSAGISRANHSDRTTGNGSSIQPSDYRTESADLKWTAPIGNDGELTLSAQILEQPSTHRVDELVAGFGQEQPSSEQFLFQPNRRSFVHAKYRKDSQAKWLDSYQIDIARQTITDDRLTQDFGSDTVRSEQNQSALDGLSLQMDKQASEDLHLTWGLEFYTDKINSARQETNLVTASTEVVRSRFPNHSSMDSAAVYLSAQWHVADRWNLGAGVRHSKFDNQRHGKRQSQAKRYNGRFSLCI